MSENGKKKSVVDRVTDGIISGIISGRFQPGSKLPTEVELCKEYEAGRNSVREAVKKLEANGVVYIRRADGTFVSETYNQKLLDPMLYQIILKKHSWEDFVQLRAVIEIGTLNVILEDEIDQEKIKNLYRIQETMEKALTESEPDPNRIMEIDTEFHAGISALADNPQITTITEYVTRLTVPSRLKAISKVVEKGEVSHFAELHREILEVISKKEKDKIVQTVTDHYVYWNGDKL